MREGREGGRRGDEREKRKGKGRRLTHLAAGSQWWCSSVPSHSSRTCSKQLQLEEEEEEEEEEGVCVCVCLT